MNKPIILTTEGVIILEKEIEDIENVLIPTAKREIKKHKLWCDEVFLKEANLSLKGLKKRLSVLKSMLEEAVRV